MENQNNGNFYAAPAGAADSGNPGSNNHGYAADPGPDPGLGAGGGNPDQMAAANGTGVQGNEPTPQGAAANPAGSPGASQNPEKLDDFYGFEESDQVPESYDFSGLADDNGNEFDSGTVETVSEIARSLGMNNDQARDLMTKGTSLFLKAQERSRMKLSSSWQQQVISDPELGGDNLVETKANARYVMKRFGAPGIREIFEKTGLGNHPEFIRMFNNIGKAIRPANTPVKGQPAPVRQQSSAERFFYNSYKGDR